MRSYSAVTAPHGSARASSSAVARPASSAVAPLMRNGTRNAACRACRDNKAVQQLEIEALTGLARRLSSVIISSATAAALTLTPLPALADLVQTVPASQVTQMARPLPKQAFDKGRVWLVFIGGAASLFLVTVAAENNEAWFPAIARANAVMAARRRGGAPDDNNPPDAGEPPLEATAQPAQAPGVSLPRAEAPTAAAAAAAVAATSAGAGAAGADTSPHSDDELQAEIQRRNAAALAEAEARAEVERQAALVEDSLRSVSARVLHNGSGGPAAPLPGSSSGGSLDAAPATEAAAAAAAAVGGYEVVAEAAGAVAAPVAWGQDGADASRGDASAIAPAGVTAAALANVLDSRELLQQYREQQEQQVAVEASAPTAAEQLHQ